ncbi:hypothetical protein OD757_05810 [Acinetobacter sp. AYS6]|uniref:hypothetical protein n=1 Tax=Acinetobacter sp. AYS6 TaxID=2983297 RepID=UPI0021D65062|nr:hypothetical protein [Acinetobacter sp. AYS6]MCU7696734.1 hypothetical protein [Acinetobacter sp. AYS6]
MKIQFLASLMAFSLTSCMVKPSIANNEEIFIPPILITSNTRSNISMMASTHGKLIADKNGCIRLGDEMGPLIIWRYGSKLENLGNGKFKITNGFSNRSVLIGEEISIGGGSYEVKSTRVTPSVPEACANHGYWLAGPMD